MQIPGTQQSHALQSGANFGIIEQLAVGFRNPLADARNGLNVMKALIQGSEAGVPRPRDKQDCVRHGSSALLARNFGIKRPCGSAEHTPPLVGEGDGGTVAHPGIFRGA